MVCGLKDKEKNREWDVKMREDVKRSNKMNKKRFQVIIIESSIHLYINWLLVEILIMKVDKWEWKTDLKHPIHYWYNVLIRLVNLVESIMKIFIDSNKNFILEKLPLEPFWFAIQTEWNSTLSTQLWVQFGKMRGNKVLKLFKFKVMRLHQWACIILSIV